MEEISAPNLYSSLFESRRRPEVVITGRGIRRVQEVSDNLTKMIPREDQERLRSLMVETITLLCKSGINYKNEFSIDGLIGITVDSDEVFLVSLKETIKSTLNSDESTSVDSGYTKSSHRKRKFDRPLFDGPDSDDCTMSIESHPDSYEDSDSSMSLYKNSSVLLSKRPTLTAGVAPLDHCLAGHSPSPISAHASCGNVVVIKEESLSDEEYFAAQDLNIGHDVTISSDQLNDSLIKDEPMSIEKLTTVEVKQEETSVTPKKTGSAQKSQRKNSSKSSIANQLSESGSNPSEFFSMFAAQYADLDSNHHDDIARLILFYPGPYVPVRNVRRKYPRYSTDFYVSAMIHMTVQRDTQTYIGELRFLPSRVKVFYKCPPQLVQMAALQKYGFTLESYTETFHKSGGASKEEESPAYHRAIMEYSPYEEVLQKEAATTT
ncbi:hypothetical protein CAPTEDRAFT_194845 [Capitella teleta]|uniref:Uncharacterized protein n=1 Tax=Capitella teleta TaxID=283909 RepID=R7T3G4_CAPTE|nr:hypothetical protein CAPTEDRAFT_194845 [Capitella teleta]|eukprot:ELT87203.1 hypothetical protein CAPTEDRAFT_194845 [Capitella teleta]